MGVFLTRSGGTKQLPQGKYSPSLAVPTQSLEGSGCGTPVLSFPAQPQQPLEELIQKHLLVLEVHCFSAHKVLTEHRTAVTFLPEMVPGSCHILL